MHACMLVAHIRTFNFKRLEGHEYYSIYMIRVQAFLRCGCLRQAWPAMSTKAMPSCPQLNHAFTSIATSSNAHAYAARANPVYFDVHSTVTSSPFDNLPVDICHSPLVTYPCSWSSSRSSTVAVVAGNVEQPWGLSNWKEIWGILCDNYKRNPKK